MERPVRIAVVGATDDRLVGELRRLPLAPEVRPLGSLLEDSEALARFQPDLLLVVFGSAADEEVGAVRLLQKLWPALGVVVVAAADRELALAPLAQCLGARLLVHPGPPGQLAATLEQVLHGGDRPRPEVFVDLAHGLADEINNPLMFASGHLQLLRASFDPGVERERERIAQVDAVAAGLDRVRAAVDRLRLLSQAAAGPRRREPVDLAALVTQAIASRANASAAATVAMPPGPHEVPGDLEQLRAMVTALLRFADEVATLGANAHLVLDVLPNARRLRLRASGPALAAWQLPRTFEPFYPQRAMRGHAHGIGLFLAQTVALGHRGQAVVRRQPDGALQFDFVLPI